MLFHYHFWTPYVEETEKFYVENGFRISLRTGKLKGNFQTFNPPLEWDDFRGKGITFRIIEARKGAINITFGFGKKVMFDHIGFLVNQNELDEICKNARELNWKVTSNDRRTFIGTPNDFRIELQSDLDVIDGTPQEARIEELELSLKEGELEKNLSLLFNKQVDNIYSVIGEDTTINKVVLSGISKSDNFDPNGVNVVRK